MISPCQSLTSLAFSGDTDVSVCMVSPSATPRNRSDRWWRLDVRDGSA